ncbi:MAG: hemolysin III family protein [Candidatus Solibacter usitatus]|nr:hemolysin III family protein [Candidatus Solibacter usitatus]
MEGVSSESLPAFPALPTIGEEIANAITHGLGALLGIAGLVVLVVRAASEGTALHVVAAAVYGSSLILLYLVSTLYHALTKGRAKRLFRILDHCLIYVLIAGTYTPFTLVTLRGAWGWSLFGAVWGLAVLGVVFKVFFTGRLHVLSTAAYVLMGWMAVVAIGPLWGALAGPALAWLVAGGLFYSLGVVFFASSRRYAHAVWHLFVLAGSVCHFAVVLRYVV